MVSIGEHDGSIRFYKGLFCLERHIARLCKQGFHSHFRSTTESQPEKVKLGELIRCLEPLDLSQCRWAAYVSLASFRNFKCCFLSLSFENKRPWPVEGPSPGAGQS